MFKCEVCGTEFEKIKSLQSHFSQSHKISSKNYYDKYLKNIMEGICFCGNKTRYKNITLGYHKYCSPKCQSNDFEVIEKRVSKNRADNHWTRRTGNGPNKGKTYEEIHGEEKALKLKRNLSRWYLNNCVGKNNPFYGKKHNPESREKIALAKKGKTYEQIYGFEKAKEIRKKKTKKSSNYTNYRYFSSFYDINLRKKILKQQNNKCVICFSELTPYRKNLHHINYVKKDNRRRNLIYLCVSCHTTTNGNRKFWKAYLRKINREITNCQKLKRIFLLEIEKKLPVIYRENLINRRIR